MSDDPQSPANGGGSDSAEGRQGHGGPPPTPGAAPLLSPPEGGPAPPGGAAVPPADGGRLDGSAPESPTSAPPGGPGLVPAGGGEVAGRTLGPAGAAERQIGTLLELAIDRGIGVEALEKLVALHERVSATRAASEFADAMAAFQEACPSIAKKSKARITTKAGIQYSYNYAELDEIAKTIGPLLHPRGLSYSWDSTVDGEQMTCVCTIRHVNGHKQTASFTAPIDTMSKMSGPQKNAAALTYARRQSLIQALGLTTADPDTDAVPVESISESQVANLTSMLAECPEGSLARFLTYLGVDALADIQAADFQAAVAALEAKRRQAR